MNCGIMELVSSFKYSAKEVEMRVAEDFEKLRALKMFNDRSVGLGLRTELHERVVTPTATFGAEFRNIGRGRDTKTEVMREMCLLKLTELQSMTD